MKRTVVVAMVFAMTLAFGLSAAVAADNGGKKLSGPHWQFNIIGHPKGGIGGDASNGRAIMIPLKTVPGPSQVACAVDGVVFTDDVAPDWVTSEPVGTKLYFVAGETFEILDRDGTDNNGATIQVPTVAATDPLNPTKTQQVIAVDVWIRVLGKPNTCMEIDAFAYDADQLAGVWFRAGSVDIARRAGRSTWVDVSKLFDVWYCQIDPQTQACSTGTSVELSVFNDVFDGYFWNILNNGTRNVQVRLYPRTL